MYWEKARRQNPDTQNPELQKPDYTIQTKICLYFVTKYSVHNYIESQIYQKLLNYIKSQIYQKLFTLIIAQSHEIF